MKENLFENAHDAVIIFSPDDETVLDVNNRACEIYAISRSEFIGLSLEEISKFPENGRKNISETLNNGINNNFETVQYRKDGSEIFLEINSSVIDYNGGQAILSVNRDITERKKTESFIKNTNFHLEQEVKKRTEELNEINENLKEEIEERRNLEDQLIKEKELWERTFTNISEGIFLIDTDYNILQCNEAFGKIVGEEPEKLIGHKSYKIVHGTSEPPEHCISYKAIKSKHNKEGKYWEPHLNKYIYSTANPVCNQDGLDFSINILRDITEENQHQKALKKSEEKFRKYVENAPVAIFLADDKGNYQDVNPEALDLLNYTREELLNLSIPDVIADTEKENTLAYFYALLQDGSTNHETKLLTSQGEIIDVYINAVKLDEGKYLAFALDISDRKKAEENIFKSLEREKELSLLKTRFISMVSHEFRTPLANIYSNAQLLEMYDEKWAKDKKEKSLSRILDSVKVLNSMLDDVSLFGKKQSGKLEYNPSPFNLESFMRSTIDETLTQFDRHREVKLIIDNDIGTVHTDKFLLRHIVTNLLSNALKYSGKQSQVIIKFNETENHQVSIAIEDNGKGIPDKEMKKIFDPFYRASNIENVSGTGLGMAIVKHCTDLLKGNLDIQSELEKGTTVSVNFPVSQNNININYEQ